MKRRKLLGNGVVALRCARRWAWASGNYEQAGQISVILNDQDLLLAAEVHLADEAGSGLFAQLITWIKEHPEEFQAFIEFILVLFMSAAEIKEAVTIEMELAAAA